MPPTQRQRRARTQRRRQVLALAAILAITSLGILTWQSRGGRVMILATAGVVILAPLLAKILPRWLTRRSLRALEIDDIDEMTGHEFERYVAALLTHQGFETTVTKGSGDLGVDIIARRQDHSVAVQCKRRADDSSRTAVSDAVAGKHHYQCEAAMVVTNQHFTPGAHQLAESTECQLIDREALAHWITDFHRQAKRS